MDRVTIGPTPITISRNDRFVVCGPDATITGAGHEGFFARETRFVSGYRRARRSGGEAEGRAGVDP